MFDYKLINLSGFTFTVGQLITFTVVLVATILVSKFVRLTLKKLKKNENAITNAHIYTLGRFVHYTILVFGVAVAVSFLGIDLSKLAIVAGALGVGIGLQNIVNNFVSGLVILLEKCLKVGDFIELNNTLVGEVVEINMRATLIRTNDNVDILIPNAELIGGSLINWTLEENIRRFRIQFSVAYGSDKALVKQAAIEAAKTISYTLHEKSKCPQVWMTGFRRLMTRSGNIK